MSSSGHSPKPLDQDTATARPNESARGVRMRIATVCSECRKQKQKCNREQPCSNCIRRGVSHLCELPEWVMRNKRSHERSEHMSSPQSKRLRETCDAESRAIPIAPSPTPASQDPAQQSAHRPLGHLWNMRGGPSYHGESYFGPPTAASIIQVPSPVLPLGMDGIHAGHDSANHQAVEATRPFRNESGPYSHIWELIGYLPRRKAVVDRLVDLFLKQLNPIFDSVHEETFMTHYSKFWNRGCGFDDLEVIDLRWLSLLFIMIAFGELLGCPEPCSRERQRDAEEASLHFYWAARKCVVLAPTFSGESPDLVRAGILISRYLVHLGRVPESWTTISFAVRMAQAQGMHIDGENWNLPRKVLETRRRLWATLYNFDRTVCLALGRPYAIHEKHCTDIKIPNIWVDRLTAAEASRAQPKDILDPTPSIYYHFQQNLSKILGSIHDECFGVAQSSTSYSSYDKILAFDKEILAWESTLPPYFRVDDPDLSMDASRPYLYWQRLYLHSAYHFARITLHRKYVFLPSMTDRYQYSRETCIASACADLSIRLKWHRPSMADRLKFHLSASKFFSSALVLSIISVREPLSRMTDGIVGDLKAFCEKQKSDQWVNDFELAEIKIVELCIANVYKSRQEHRAQSQVEPDDFYRDRGNSAQINAGRSQGWSTSANAADPDYTVEDFVSQITSGTGVDAYGEFGRSLLDLWFGPSRPDFWEMPSWDYSLGDL